MTSVLKSPPAAPGLPRLSCVAAAAIVLAMGGCVSRAEPGDGAAPEEQGPPQATTQRPTSGEVPADLVDRVIEDLVEQEGLQRDAIEVERAESVIWPDGSLGCPRPGEMYTQAHVPGYWVVLRVEEKQYDYRMADKGHFRRCIASFKIQLPVG